VHICRKWRRIVFASQRALHLRLFCTQGTPVLKTLDCWPALPIAVEYRGPPALDPLAPEHEDNIIAALKKSDRVGSISLTITSSLLGKLSAIERPFSELEDLVLLSRDSVPLTLPSTFRWGLRLRTLHLTRAAIPALPELLAPSKRLVDLQLHKIPSVGYFSPEALANALSGMTHLQTLSLHFLSFTLPRNTLDLPPQSGECVVLPTLMCLKYRGTSKYLDGLVDRIDAPHLGDIDITFFSQPTMSNSQLGRFINRIEMQKSHRRADIISSKCAISISFTQPEAPTRLELRVSSKQLARQLSYMPQICNGLSAFLLTSGVEDLRISATQPSSGQDDSDHEGWLNLIRLFRGTKCFYVAGDFSTDILLALHQSSRSHRRSRWSETVLLPVMHKLYISQPGPRHAPLREAVVSLMTSRRKLSGHPIAVEYERLCHISELRGTGTTYVQYQHHMLTFSQQDLFLSR